MEPELYKDYPIFVEKIDEEDFIKTKVFKELGFTVQDLQKKCVTSRGERMEPIFHEKGLPKSIVFRLKDEDIYIVDLNYREE